jgi:hypothetical protein
MEEMITVLMAYRANFSVEFFAEHQKVRVRKSGIWDRNKLWDEPVFKALQYRWNPLNVTWTSNGATPTAIVEYLFDRKG